MKLQRKSTDGCGVVIWWFDNNTRIVRVPKEHTQGNFPVYVAETGFRIGENFKSSNQLSWQGAKSACLRLIAPEPKTQGSGGHLWSAT